MFIIIRCRYWLKPCVGQYLRNSPTPPILNRPTIYHNSKLGPKPQILYSSQLQPHQEFHSKNITFFANESHIVHTIIFIYLFNMFSVHYIQNTWYRDLIFGLSEQLYAIKWSDLDLFTEWRPWPNYFRWWLDLLPVWKHSLDLDLLTTEWPDLQSSYIDLPAYSWP